MNDFSFERLDLDGTLAESADAAGGISRACLVAAAAGDSAALVAVAAEQAHGQGSKDVAILNYALVLEYLQSAFYTEAERLRALQGDPERAARVVGSVERAHVQAFKDVLGRKAAKRPSFDFQGTTEDPEAFLRTAVAFEDLAVAAYKGQAPRIAASSALMAAVSIHSVEARHAAWMRYLVGANPAKSALRRAEVEGSGRPAGALDQLRDGGPVDQAGEALSAVHRVSGGDLLAEAANRSDADRRRRHRRSRRDVAVARVRVDAVHGRPAGRAGVRPRRPAPGWAHAGAPCIDLDDSPQRGCGAVLAEQRVACGCPASHPHAGGDGQPAARPRPGSRPPWPVWVRVRLAVLPNGTTAWVPRAAIGGYRTVRNRLVVDLARRRRPCFATAGASSERRLGWGCRGGRRPRGRFFIRNKLVRYRSGFYGPLAFGTSARSAVLTDWPDGGFVGIHGTDRPDLVPGAVSHGCIRMRNPDIRRLSLLLPVGTPLTIV